jgi:hypothetical protein
MIIPSITTISKNWRDEIGEIEELGLKEVNIFLTGLIEKERGILYQDLKKIGITKIPFVHIRSDMDIWELDLLVNEFDTEAFNIHTQREFPLEHNLDKYKKLIFVENTYFPLDENEIKEFAGICLDFSHLDSDRRFREDIYEQDIKMIEKYGCGCNHISPQKMFPLLNKEDKDINSKHPHFFNSLSEFNYLKNYPRRYFSPYLAVEIENSIKEQLEAIEYIKSILPYAR